MNAKNHRQEMSRRARAGEPEGVAWREKERTKTKYHAERRRRLKEAALFYYFSG